MDTETTPTFTPAQVKEGKRLVAAGTTARFELGKLALQVAPMNDRPGRPSNSGTSPNFDALLNEFAEAIGEDGWKLIEARNLVHWYSGHEATAINTGWSVLRALRSVYDRPADAMNRIKRDPSVTVRALKVEADEKRRKAKLAADKKRVAESGGDVESVVTEPTMPTLSIVRKKADTDKKVAIVIGNVGLELEWIGSSIAILDEDIRKAFVPELMELATHLSATIAAAGGSWVPDTIPADPKAEGGKKDAA